MPDVTTLEYVHGQLIKQPGTPDAAFETDYKAAEAYVQARCRWADGSPVPDDLVKAVVLLTARYQVRRKSPDGFVGMGEFGPARIATVDRDVTALIGPYRPVVFG